MYDMVVHGVDMHCIGMRDDSEHGASMHSMSVLAVGQHWYEIAWHGPALLCNARLKHAQHGHARHENA